MKAFQIQDHDNPAVVIAEDWRSAIDAWRKRLMEIDGDPDCMSADPDGIALLADETDEIILDGFVDKAEHERVKRDFATADNSARVWRSSANKKVAEIAKLRAKIRSLQQDGEPKNKDRSGEKALFVGSDFKTEEIPEECCGKRDWKFIQSGLSGMFVCYQECQVCGKVWLLRVEQL